MNTTPAILLFFFFFIVFPILIILSYTIKGRNVRRKTGYHYKGVTLKISQERIQAVLTRRFPYFSKLSKHRQDFFMNRVRIFLGYNTFETRQELKLTDEICILVAATYIRMTMGMDDRSFLLEDFRNIIIYPFSYYSPVSRTKNKGETGSQGLIILSWKDFSEGLSVQDDGLNLGYHEFAHAIMLEASQSGFRGGNFGTGYQLLSHHIADNDLAGIAHRTGIFRDYAFTNKMEFFAVTSELFFEVPGKLRAASPAIYYLFCRIYKLNPITDELPEGAE